MDKNNQFDKDFDFEKEYGFDPAAILDPEYESDEAMDSSFLKNVSQVSSMVAPCTRTPALKSIQFFFFSASGVLVATLTVGIGAPTGVPRPVVKSTICAPEAISAVIAQISLPGP